MTRQVWVGITVGVVGLLGIGLVQGIPNRHSMEDDLTRRSSLALEQAGISGAQVRFVGRDGALVVSSAADVERAREVVAAVKGVRVVSVRGPEAPKRKPSVTIAVDAGRIEVSGIVADEGARSALVGRLGAGAQASGLTVDAGVGADGVDGLGAVVDSLGTKGKGLKIELREGRISLAGVVESAVVRDTAVAAAGKAVGAGNVTDQLTVAAPPEEVQRALISLPPITFENDSAVLTPEGQAAVAKAAEVLRANPAVVVRIEGHTDATGSAASNLALSQARAQAVMDSLIAQGIAAGRLSAVGLGETRLKVPDTTPENRAINRRVEFIIQNSGQ
ncbi:MAG TPA: OmpA family protein [Candidatus Limnocylindrales bacterium]|nr:OmpA family protein [Candidatus Limnocylindrales bacterium]